MTVRGAKLLGIGAMVGVGMSSLRGDAGVVAVSAVWLSFVLATLVDPAPGAFIAGPRPADRGESA